jgi:exonuclease SbcD
MPAEPFRFVHAADLHLEQPLSGLSEAPEYLRAALVDAPYTAAQRIFDCVLAENADFLLLAGDVLNVHHAGPRAVVFLLDQFERLAARDVAVYWTGGVEDAPETWPAAAKVPPNVHLFARGEVEALTHYRHEEPICRVAGTSSGEGQIHPEEFPKDENGLFTIAVAHGRAEATLLAEQGIDYWALGGIHERRSLITAPGTAHYSGTPQGRSPAETGPHGCTLVNVDLEGKVRTQFVATDSLRWHVERLAISDKVSREEQRRLLGERMRALASDNREHGALVNWTVEQIGSPIWKAGQSVLAAELIDWLRMEFGAGDSPIWTGSLEFEPPTALPQAWCEEDTILGDFLRAVQVHEADDRQPLDVAVYLSASQREGELAPALELADPATRRRALREAAALGIELLRGEAT